MVIVIPYGEQDIDQSDSTEVKMKKVKTILMMGLIIMVLTISNNPSQEEEYMSKLHHLLRRRWL